MNINIKNFLKVPVNVFLYSNDISNTKILDMKQISVLNSKEKKSLLFPILKSFFSSPNNFLYIRFMIPSPGGDVIFGDYCLSSKKIPENLYIGKIRCEKIFSSSGYVPIIKDMPEIYLNNLTGFDLTFNNNIKILKRSELKYEGFDRTGISNGFILRNNQGIFDDYKITNSLTKIFYGLISDKENC